MILCKCGKTSTFVFIHNGIAWCSDCLIEEMRRLKSFETWYYDNNHNHIIKPHRCGCFKGGFHVRAQNGETWCFDCLNTEIERLTVFEIAYFKHIDRLNSKKKIPQAGHYGEPTFEDKMILIFLNRPDIHVGQSADSNEMIVHHKFWKFEGRSHSVVSAAKAAMLAEQTLNKGG